jgi:hypothetical protein
MSSNSFGIISLQTNNTLFLADPMFAQTEEIKLQKTNFLAKDQE